MDAIDIALDQMFSGFNCSQAILSAFSQQFDLPVEMALRIAAPFGAGIGRMGRTCGAVSGAFMVIGLKYGNVWAEDQISKEKAYQVARLFAERFQARLGSLECRELLGYDLSKPEELQLIREMGLFQIRCPELVRASVEVLAELVEP
jgi:C_GCAxxG_C_C family probable redox protein